MSGEHGEHIDIDKEHRELLEAEPWIEYAVTWVRTYRGIDEDIARASVRWATMWLDDFHTEAKAKAGNGLSENELTALMLETKRSSFARCDAVLSYSSDTPSLMATIAAMDAFCLGFGEEADMARRMLDWPAPEA